MDLAAVRTAVNSKGLCRLPHSCSNQVGLIGRERQQPFCHIVELRAVPFRTHDTMRGM